MGKLTDIKIKSLKPRDKSFLYREDAPRGEGGFAIRVLPSGVKTWQIIYTFEGKRRWLSLGQYPNMGLADARKKFKQAKQLLEQGKNPGDDGEAKAAAARGAITVNELCDKFLEEYASKQKRPNSTKEDRLNLKRDVRKKIGNRS